MEIIRVGFVEIGAIGVILQLRSLDLLSTFNVLQLGSHKMFHKMNTECENKLLEPCNLRL